ncbi:MAG: CaiB/BaiF CoA-transferase family protein [Pseudomonadota bacterium]
MQRPLSGFRIIELAGIGPGPFAGQILADLGAELICVERPGAGLGLGPEAIERRGKQFITVNLREADGVNLVLKLVAQSHGLFEGNRPGVAERLGIGPAACHAINPRLVYARMTGWGQTGPWANKAGHDINYLSMTGALQAIGTRDAPPPPPLNLLGDYGGGSMNLVIGMLAGLLKAQSSGEGDVIDCAIVDGVGAMMGVVYSLAQVNLWQTRRQANLLDGAMPFYRCYATKDDRFMAVGCIEPQFFTVMLETLNLDSTEFGGQMDPSCWPRQHQTLEELFATRSRDEWAQLFDAVDACVTPVLDYQEATTHTHADARAAYQTIKGHVHPRSFPVFASVPNEPDHSVNPPGSDSRNILESLGYDEAHITQLTERGVVR